ncbi:hypothetical protein [Candidatus Ferrigenium straubiae]|uniref:hypothetical protein n=1 Tax=Candidatus Ferrigenium straubiae TaxID=2919506 RepID=UPI003F4A9923
MKRFLLVLAGVLLAASFSISAQAGSYGEPVAGMGKMRGECMGMDKTRGDCMMMGWHKMTGTVDRIDHSRGMLTLRSGATDMALHFPPSSIKDLKNGDTITVDLGFSRGKPASMD